MQHTDAPKRHTPRRHCQKVDCGTDTHPTITSTNINSLKALRPGGLTGDFYRTVCFLTCLLATQGIVCIQDTRLPTKDFAKTLSSIPQFFDCEVRSTGCGQNWSGGCTFLIHKKVTEKYKITHKQIVQGAAHVLELEDKNTGKLLYVFNVYLDAGDETRWREQIRTLTQWGCPPNSIYAGDFNHVAAQEDRTGYHKDKTKASAELFEEWKRQCGLEEIEQPLHTFYGKREGRLFSSRIDKFYHNLTYEQLDRHKPEAKVITCAPYSIAQYSNQRFTNSSYQDSMAITDFRLKQEGGTHVTDHLPICLKFPQTTTTTTNYFPTNVLKYPEFTPMFTKAWEEEDRPMEAFAQLKELKDTLWKVAKRMARLRRQPQERDQGVYDKIRLLRELEKLDNTTDIHHKFSHIADLDVWINDPSALVDSVNNQLASDAYNQPTKLPTSKLAYLAATLPKEKEKLTSIFDADNECITEDPDRVTAIVHKFWRNKWQKRNTKNTKLLFKCYGKRIAAAEKAIEIEDVVQAIYDTTDTAPGPDAIPFAAYRATVDIAGPILHGCIRHLRAGKPPPDGFNAGSLVLLPKKGLGTAEDTRPLVINNTDNRIIAKCIKNSINDSLEKLLSTHQNGFREGRSTDTNVSFFNEKFYSALEQGKFYDVLLADFQKAFDSVDHDAIFELLDSVGYDKGTQYSIRALFQDAHCYTTIKGAAPTRIDFHSGVKQGCPLSPSLFILVMDVIIDMLTATTGADVKCFADDLAIGAENLHQYLPTIKQCFKIFGDATGLRINPTKSAIVPTGGASSLREYLESVGWGDMQVLDQVMYLGVPIGRAVTLDTVFKQPHAKLVSRLTKFSKVKHKYSLQDRVLIWNVWLLPIMSYVCKFFVMPCCYTSLIDRDCADWLNKGNNFKGLHYTRPTGLVGLATPLRDIMLHNYASLNNHYNGTEAELHDATFDWTMRTRVHQMRAHNHIKGHYHSECEPAAEVSKTYKHILASSSQREEYLPYIAERLNKMGVEENQHEQFLTNYSKLPAWTPGYVRENTIWVLHNSHFTATRLGHTNTRCPLCKSGADSLPHLYNDCTYAAGAAAKLWSSLGKRRDLTLTASISADQALESQDCLVQAMLTTAIWRARSNAALGIQRSAESWATWIQQDILSRIVKHRPNFFNEHYQNARVSTTYRVNYRASIGSSKGTAEEKARAQQVIDNHVNSLPDNDAYAFTDGSATPNPGPCGAGATITYNGNTTPLTAYLGHGTNNIGEIYAIGMVVDHFRANNEHCNIHIYTDSKMVHDALSYGWAAGKDNRELLKQVRSTIRHYKTTGGNVIFHWVPGHSGIVGNEAADKLAGAGALYSDAHCTETLDLANIVKQDTFLSQLVR